MYIYIYIYIYIKNFTRAHIVHTRYINDLENLYKIGTRLKGVDIYKGKFVSIIGTAF